MHKQIKISKITRLAILAGMTSVLLFSCSNQRKISNNTNPAKSNTSPNPAIETKTSTEFTYDRLNSPHVSINNGQVKQLEAQVREKIKLALAAPTVPQQDSILNDLKNLYLQFFKDMQKTNDAKLFVVDGIKKEEAFNLEEEDIDPASLRDYAKASNAIQQGQISYDPNNADFKKLLADLEYAKFSSLLLQKLDILVEKAANTKPSGTTLHKKSLKVVFDTYIQLLIEADLLEKILGEMVDLLPWNVIPAESKDWFQKQTRTLLEPVIKDYFDRYLYIRGLEHACFNLLKEEKVLENPIVL